MTSGLPSVSTATTCRSIQLQNHSRPSCQRGDSGIPRPRSRILGSGITSLSFPAAAFQGRPSTPYTNDKDPDRQPAPGALTRQPSRSFVVAMATRRLRLARSDERTAAMSIWNFMDPASKMTLLGLVRREAEGMFALVDTDQKWTAPTGCPGWEARDVIGHLVDTTET